MIIKISDTIGPRCIISADGQKIYDLIRDEILAGNAVCLDFSGVNQFASPFFNYAIGQLLKDIAEEDLRKRLTFDNVNETGEMVIDRVIENSAQYNSNKDYKKIVDDMLDSQAKESE